MTTIDDVGRAIKNRNRAVERLQRKADKHRDTPWYAWNKRRKLKQEMSRLRETTSEAETYFRKGILLAIAKSEGPKLWDDAASDVIPHKNPYGLDALMCFESIMETVLKRVGDHRVPTPDAQLEFSVRYLPELHAIITQDFIEGYVLQEMQERVRIAQSPRLLVSPFTVSNGDTVFMIQHEASGLRAEFKVFGNGFGTIGSKSDELPTIDPHGRHSQVDVRRFANMGIGAVIYQHAETVAPGVRWQGGSYSDQSRALRKKLHLLDPLIWSGPCDWCTKNLRGLGADTWEKARPHMFANHP